MEWAENCNHMIEVCNHGEPHARTHRERISFTRKGKVSWEGCHKLRVHGLSLTEDLTGKKRNLLPSSWTLLLPWGVSAPTVVSWLWDFCLLIFLLWKYLSYINTKIVQLRIVSIWQNLLWAYLSTYKNCSLNSK